MCTPSRFSQVSKQEISGKLGIEFMKGKLDASGSFTNDETMSTIDISKAVRTNTKLPAECNSLGVGPSFDVEQLGICVDAWMAEEANAAYMAYAVPYVYHPEYQRVLEELETGSSSAANAGRRRQLLQSDGPAIDYKFKETGMLKFRVTTLESTLDRWAAE